MTDGIQYFTSPDGLRLAYRDSGPQDGLPVLCLAGLTRNSRDFDYVLPHFPQLRWIRPDYRGRGASDRAPDAAGYTVPAEARDALALLDHLGLDRVAVLGTSRGGIIAMVLAATVPQRLRGICLNDVGPELETAGLEHIRGYIGRPPEAPDLDALARAKARAAVGFQDVPLSRWREEAERQAVVTESGLAMPNDPALAQAFAAAMDAPQPDMWPLFDAAAALPLAMIRGAGSNLLSAAAFARMRARAPDAIWAEVPGRGHVPFLDEPQSLACIADWIAACR